MLELNAPRCMPRVDIVRVIEGDQVLADHLVDRVAEHPRMRRVGTDDAEVRSLDRRRHGRFVEQRSEVLRALAQRRLGALALGDVRADQRVLEVASLLVAQRLALDLEHPCFTVPRIGNEFHTTRLAACNGLVDGHDRRSIRFGALQQGMRDAAAHVLQRVAGKLRAGVVGPLDAPGRVQDHHHLLRPGGHHRQPARLDFAFAQVALGPLPFGHTRQLGADRLQQLELLGRRLDAVIAEEFDECRDVATRDDRNDDACLQPGIEGLDQTVPVRHPRQIGHPMRGA